jgi:hypothetical protein
MHSGIQERPSLQFKHFAPFSALEVLYQAGLDAYQPTAPAFIALH